MNCLVNLLLALLLHASFLVVNSEETTRFVFIHVAKTGGSNAQYVIPRLLGSKDCNQIYKISTFGDYHHDIKNMSDGHFGPICDFLSFEWHAVTMESALRKIGYDAGTYRLLTTLRSPLSHFFSVLNHMRGERAELTIEELITENETPGQWHYYNMRNFQSNFFTRISPEIPTDPRSQGSKMIANLTDAHLYIKNMYWFGIIEHWRLSLGLLHCQVLGPIKDVKTFNELANAHISGITREPSFSLNAKQISRIHKLTTVDNVLYSLVVGEFWVRVKAHSACLQFILDGKGIYL